MNPRVLSEAYFRKPPQNYNCAQAVLLGFRDVCGVTDEEVARFAPYRGGRTPTGECGALYAANYLLARRGLPTVREAFEKEAGALTCLDIRTRTHYPCVACVQLADRLLSERLKADIPQAPQEE